MAKNERDRTENQLRRLQSGMSHPPQRPGPFSSSSPPALATLEPPPEFRTPVVRPYDYQLRTEGDRGMGVEEAAGVVKEVRSADSCARTV